MASRSEVKCRNPFCRDTVLGTFAGVLFVPAGVFVGGKHWWVELHDGRLSLVIRCHHCKTENRFDVEGGRLTVKAA